MRIPIRIQLALLVLFFSLMGLMVLALATVRIWPLSSLFGLLLMGLVVSKLQFHHEYTVRTSDPTRSSPILTMSQSIGPLPNGVSQSCTGVGISIPIRVICAGYLDPRSHSARISEILPRYQKKS